MTSDPLSHTAHRPWPLPRGPWLMRMTWRDLLFAHWPVDREAMRPLVPEPLTLDTFDGSAWLAVTPFLMTDVRPRAWPSMLAWQFPELNVRTYVTLNGKPGVYFFSLDAAHALAVRTARLAWNLPYYEAQMFHRQENDWIVYHSARTHRAAPTAQLATRYRPVGEPGPAEAGSFEAFAIERYCLYTVDRAGRAHRGEIHHPPWQLQSAEAHFELLEMTAHLGVPLSQPAARLHYAKTMPVVAWRPHRAGAA